MLARMRKSMDEKDQGFTLIELLVVMIIIGILAAIAIPVFLNQRKKAVDTAAKADVSTLGKEVATYYVDATTVLAPTAGILAAGSYTFAAPVGTVGRASNGVTKAELKYHTATPVTTIAATDTTPTGNYWCVELTYSGGTATQVSYSAANGLTSGPCT